MPGIACVTASQVIGNAEFCGIQPADSALIALGQKIPTRPVPSGFAAGHEARRDVHLLVVTLPGTRIVDDGQQFRRRGDGTEAGRGPILETVAHHGKDRRDVIRRHQRSGRSHPAVAQLQHRPAHQFHVGGQERGHFIRRSPASGDIEVEGTGRRRGHMPHGGYLLPRRDVPRPEGVQRDPIAEGGGGGVIKPVGIREVRLPRQRIRRTRPAHLHRHRKRGAHRDVWGIHVADVRDAEGHVPANAGPRGAGLARVQDNLHARGGFDGDSAGRSGGLTARVPDHEVVLAMGRAVEEEPGPGGGAIHELHLQRIERARAVGQHDRATRLEPGTVDGDRNLTVIANGLRRH